MSAVGERRPWSTDDSASMYYKVRGILRELSVLVDAATEGNATARLDLVSVIAKRAAEAYHAIEAESGAHVCPAEVDVALYDSAALCAAINLLALMSDHGTGITPNAASPVWLGEKAYGEAMERLAHIAWQGFPGVAAPPFDIGEDDDAGDGAR